jgi:hypothetical protein
LGCSNDENASESEPEPEPQPVANLAPNDFDINIVNVSSNDATINWTEATDPEEDDVTYNIYLNGNIISQNISELTYQFTELNELTNYSGKVVALDSNNNETFKTFSFTTEKYYLKFALEYDYIDTPFTGGGQPYSMIKTSDSNYLITGKCSNPNGSGNMFFVLKINYEGEELWKKFYDYPVGDSWNFNITESSNSYIVASFHHVLNIDFDGNLIWAKEINSYDIPIGPNEINGVKTDSKNNIFVIGYRFSYENNIETEAVLTKLDINGNVIFERTYIPSPWNSFNDLIINSSNELIILGSIDNADYSTVDHNDSSPEQIDFWVLKLDNNGNELWQNSFGDDKHDVPTQIISTSDNKFVSVGYGPSLFKFDEIGNVIWSNTELSAYNPTFSVAETNDNGYVATGIFEFGTYGALGISKYNNSGNLEWEKSYQESFTHLWGKAILSEQDGGFRIAATKWQFYYVDDERPKIKVYKTDPEGNYE